ncbi:hypothetical protein LOAG_12147 [Loa loa]|nr:hypothetical protein LOAG_12147 [Loa loa]EFO16360.2 hypothetical protein LOAG_12147 [Loa loa]
MVWRNDNYRIRRRLPSIPTESKTFPTLARLNLCSMLSPISLDDDDDAKRPLQIDDESIEKLQLSEYSRQSWTPTVRLTFPVHSNQRRELPIEEGVENCGKLSKL